ncbi:hypothetical protein [Nocardia barduliensis]|nr:hypothetical protein [Nocardia barduliensis]
MAEPVFPGCSVLVMASQALDALLVKPMRVGDVIEADDSWL